MKFAILRTSLSKKYVMAATGCGLFIFVILHLLGNLQIFLGPNQINRYGNLLQTTPELLWPARAVLLIFVALHIWTSAQLSIENRAARPVRYRQQELLAASPASRTMLMSGAIIACFVVYHLLHFTAEVKAVNFTGQDFVGFREAGRHDVYRMMVVGFSNPWVSLFYLLGIGLLCLHLSHGASSMFQSVGWRNRAWTPCLDRCARVAALLIFLGYASIPLAILTGLIRWPPSP